MKAAKPDDRLEELLLDLPQPARELGPSLHVRESGDYCIVGAALPYTDGRLMHRGRLGLELRLDHGQVAARTAVVQALAMLKAHFGSLNKIKECVQLTGYIAASADFKDHLKVLDQASALLTDIFGATAGKHTRTALGVSSLPDGACVMIELMVRV